MDTKTDSSDYKHTNALIDESSPYLLQHAHNPVDWYPWGEEAFNKARKEDKMVLVSIGYSACHWCHVMERESFESEEVAEYMNEHFVSIKVDREERPDVDQVYMNAVQLMTGSGGWPLNCFTLPDGRPVYGGTYFPTKNWLQILHKLVNLWENDRAKLEEYATQLTSGVQQSELVTLKSGVSEFKPEVIDAMVNQWRSQFDLKEGGPNKAPKFPIPNNYQFMLRYGHQTGDKELVKYVHLTLKKMARGGIYDQIGGGFARYSTDAKWKVPHFEKMLYDNAQLISLYSEAYNRSGIEEYKDVVYETIDFINRELKGPNGEFYSALDADSEGEEGLFYTWTKDELKDVLGQQYNLASDYYNVNDKGRWEGRFILLRDKSDSAFAKSHNLNEEELKQELADIDQKLMEARNKRVRPGLDDKSLTSWNALMARGFLDAYNVFGNQSFLNTAIENAAFIQKYQLRGSGGLNHNYKAKKSTINGYLEDYAFTIDLFITLYETTFEKKWLQEAKMLADYTIDHFYDESSGMFYFTSDEDPELIARKTEVMDNVIPASNSVLAKALFKLSIAYDNSHYKDLSDQMLWNVYENMTSYPPGYSNWAMLALWHTQPFYEVVIMGEDAEMFKREFNNHYVPNKFMMGSDQPEKLPLLQDRYVDGETRIYVCVEKACKLPVNSVEDAIEQLK